MFLLHSLMPLVKDVISDAGASLALKLNMFTAIYDKQKLKTGDLRHVGKREKHQFYVRVK